MDNDKQRRRNERGQRADVYMVAQAEDFPADSRGGILAARLKELLAQTAALDVARAENINKRRQGTEGRAQTRTSLRRMVKTAWGTYKTLTRQRDGLDGLFESPSKMKNDQSLAAGARAYANAAAALAGLFTDFGLPPAFFAEMRSKADSLEAYTTIQNEGVGAGVDTNASIEETLRQMDEVVESLDTVVTNRYANDPAKLAAWESASRVERAPRSKSGGDTPTPPPANG